MRSLFFVLMLVGLPVASALTDAARADDLTLEAILDSWAAALGGREKLESIQSTHFTLKAKMAGMEGDLEAWSTAKGQQRINLSLGGVFEIVQVFDQDHGWVKDQNGKVTEMTGQQLTGEIATAYVNTWSYLLPGRKPGKVEYLGKEEGTGLLTIKILPDGGEEIFYYLDPETYLPARSERASGDRTAVTTYSDWTSYEGVRFAGQFTQSHGNAQFDSSFEVVSGEFNQSPPPGTFSMPGEEVDDVVFAAGSKATEVPLELNGVHIFVQVSVNGSEPMWFILDTGAGVTVMDMAVAEKLGLEMKGEIEARGAGEGSQTASFISDMSYQVGGVKLTNQRATAIPLSMLEPMFGRKIDGILGYDFISRFVMTIDYDNKKLHLVDRKGYEYTGTGTVVPIRMEHGHPHLTATVTPNGKEAIEAEYLIDTGAGMSVGFTRPFVEKNDLLATLPKKYKFEGGGGVGGKMQSYVGRVEKFEIENLAFDNLVCGFSQDQGGAGANPNLAGIIGGDILQCFTVIFDYERNQMILEPAKMYGDPVPHDLGGVAFKTGEQGAWHDISIRYVQPESPAAKAGLKEGDTVLSVDGRPAAELTINQLQRMTKDGPRTMEIVIERDGKEMTKKVKLESMV